MKRKLRHPHQVLEVDELVVDESYKFVSQYKFDPCGPHCHKEFTMLGVAADTLSLARQRGRDDWNRADTFFDLSPARGSRVTVHKDGWFGHRNVAPTTAFFCVEPTLVYWLWLDGVVYSQNWDKVSSYLGDPKVNDVVFHSLIVPKTAWDADPRIHILDWINPDDTIDRAVVSVNTTTAEEFEHTMRKRTDEAMRKALGF